MVFKSNFLKLSWTLDGKLLVEGESNDELLAATERIYVTVVPLSATPVELEVHEVKKLGAWSAEVPMGAAVGDFTVVGVALIQNEHPFMWTQVISRLELPDEPVVDPDDVNDDVLTD